MSKSNVIESNAFKNTSAGMGFNLAPQVNNFNSIFDIKPLDEAESNSIERLLEESYIPSSINEEQFERDLYQIKTLTSEIRAIGRQGTVLMGERVHKAKEILKRYKDGTFTRWLESTFGTRKTGYNNLSYFELYNELPTDLKDSFKKIPLRAAYALASREGSLDQKKEIIREYYDKSHNELVSLIQEKLPSASGDKRCGKISTRRLLTNLRDTIHNLHTHKAELTTKDKAEIDELKGLLDALLLDV